MRQCISCIYIDIYIQALILLVQNIFHPVIAGCSKKYVHSYRYINKSTISSLYHHNNKTKENSEYIYILIYIYDTYYKPLETNELMSEHLEYIDK